MTSLPPQFSPIFAPQSMVSSASLVLPNGQTMISIPQPTTAQLQAATTVAAQQPSASPPANSLLPPSTSYSSVAQAYPISNSPFTPSTAAFSVNLLNNSNSTQNY
uniref:Uncharacterized protein n=1 Tax=Lygus hesperus TaxID=30085 RepID=A0A0A9YJ43_LYGHE